MKNTANYDIYFPIIAFALLGLVVFFDLKYDMLRDSSTAAKKPYSFAKVQLAFWLIIIITSFTTIIICGRNHDIPTFANSTLIILGISTGTLAAGRLIDVSDQKDPAVTRSQDDDGDGFLLDILSDESGVSLHRLQCLLFNVIIGGWFCFKVLFNLGQAAANAKFNIDLIIPDVTPNNLILLGISAGTYVALKTNENKPVTSPVADAGNIQSNPVINPIAQLQQTGAAVLNAVAKIEPEFIKDEAAFNGDPAAG